jgi:hypothetical protein
MTDETSKEEPLFATLTIQIQLEIMNPPPLTKDDEAALGAVMAKAGHEFLAALKSGQDIPQIGQCGPELEDPKVLH